MIKKILRKNRFTSGLLEVYFFSKNHLKAKGWFESRFLHQPVDNKSLPLPWFTYSSIHFIEQKLAIKPMTVFEFGSGNSTLWLSSKVKNIVSIENNEDFYNKMRIEIDLKDNVLYSLNELNNNYSSKILEYENEFDIVVIDGRERVKCTKNSINALRANGVIIFDNSDRVEYEEAYKYLAKLQFKKIDFKGIGPIGHSEWQTTVYYRDENCFNI